MKFYLIVASLLFASLGSAQQVGKAGKLLQNEASTNEMSKKIPSPGNTQLENMGNPASKQSVPGELYQRNSNYGSSEIFLRIPKLGYYTVRVGNQTIENSSGKFRFFDLAAGSTPLSIFRNGFLLYRTHIRLNSSQRMVLDFFPGSGLYLLATYRINPGYFGFPHWDDLWNSNYPNAGIGSGNLNRQPMSTREFTAFLQNLKRASFDDQKIRLIQAQVKVSWFTSSQIKQILQNLSFDPQRLVAGKILFDKCVDPQNFHQVYQVFSFKSYRDQLMQYVNRR